MDECGEGAERSALSCPGPPDSMKSGPKAALYSLFFIAFNVAFK
jgi:hypothetical protein